MPIQIRVNDIIGRCMLYQKSLTFPDVSADSQIAPQHSYIPLFSWIYIWRHKFASPHRFALLCNYITDTSSGWNVRSILFPNRLIRLSAEAYRKHREVRVGPRQLWGCDASIRTFAVTLQVQELRWKPHRTSQSLAAWRQILQYCGRYQYVSSLWITICLIITFYGQFSFGHWILHCCWKCVWVFQWKENKNVM